MRHTRRRPVSDASPGGMPLVDTGLPSALFCMLIPPFLTVKSHKLEATPAPNASVQVDHVLHCLQLNPQQVQPTSAAGGGACHGSSTLKRAMCFSFLQLIYPSAGDALLPRKSSSASRVASNTLRASQRLPPQVRFRCTQLRESRTSHPLKTLFIVLSWPLTPCSSHLRQIPIMAMIDAGPKLSPESMSGTLEYVYSTTSEVAADSSRRKIDQSADGFRCNLRNQPQHRCRL